MTYQGAMNKLTLSSNKVKKEVVGQRHSNLAARIIAGRGATQFPQVPNSQREAVSAAGRSLA